MGLSSKQVASDRHSWNQALLQASTLELPKPSSMKRPSSQVQQQQQQGGEPLKCPRCESTNTKFCYYNNYNKSQPRHFCKACKRHWTKGGTLRNVPVGGGRKNKRLKTSNSGVKAASKTNNSITTTSSTTTTTTTNDNIKMLIQSQQQQQQPTPPQQPRFSLPLVGLSSSLTLGGFDDKNFTEEFYKTIVRQPAKATMTSPLPESSITFNHNKGLNDDGPIFMGATSSQQQQQQSLQFPYSNLGSFESNNPCSISSSPNFYTLTGDHQPNNGLEGTVMNSLNNNTSLSSSSMSDHHQPWNATTTTPTTTSNMIDISSNWGWDDFDKFVTVDADLTMPWDDDDDTDIKPSGP